MKMRTPWLPALAVALLAIAAAPAADWPAYRHDAQRSSATAEKLSFPLQQAWRHTCAQPPAPAWRPTTKYFNRLDFDYAPQPVVAGGMLVFGSSADCTIRGLDAASGVEKWRYITNGPVRFAPQLAAGKVYAVADDGWVYCLDLVSGAEVWKFRAAPRPDLILGDNRMISCWPLRSGLLVDKGMVYTVAGMWPSEGVFVYALDAATGKVIWCNDTAGAISPGDGGVTGAGVYVFGNASGTGMAPQGWLLASQKDLVVPVGRSSPARFDLKTGELRKLGGSRKHTYGTAPPFTLLGELELAYTDTHNTKGGRETAIWQTVPAAGFKDLPQPSRGSEGMADPEKGLDVALLVTKDAFYARKGYGIALAGGVLLVGGDGFVAAYETAQTSPASKYGRNTIPPRHDAAGQREFWRAPVDGQARGLAVADGRLFVSTHLGEIYCFAPGAAPAAAVHHQPGAGRPPLEFSPAETRLLDGLLADAGPAATGGYALVVGDPDGRLALGLAARTPLLVMTVLNDAAAAQALRERLLDTTAWHGSRLQVFTAPADGRLDFSPYFAGLVAVAGEPGPIPAAELYRVLRPLGGVLACPGLAPDRADKLLRQAGASDGELVTAGGGSPLLRRGALPGAFDWNAREHADRHLRAPLRYLWFGGPDPMKFVARGLTSRTCDLLAANGRVFHLLDGELAAFDIYTGRELWRRPVPGELRPLTVDGRSLLAECPPFDRDKNSPYQQWQKAPRAVRGFAADADNVYLTLGETCFRGVGDNSFKIAAANGAVRGIYGRPVTPVAEVDLRTPQTWQLPVDDEHEGKLSMGADAAGLRLELVTKDPEVTAKDQWILYFDFRPAPERYGFYGRGTFQVFVRPAVDAQTPAGLRRGRGEAFPEIAASGSRTPDGSVSILEIPWAELERLTGGRPDSFGFAAALSNHDGAKQKKKVNKLALAGSRAWLFGDAVAPALNNGWACVMLNGATAAAELAALRQPAAFAGELEKLPAELRRLPSAGGHFRPDKALASAPRIHPLTGRPSRKTYPQGNGCGLTYSSANMHYLRSGTLGVYDLLDDSGIRHFGGVRPSCGMNMLAANGVLFVSEDDSDCGCLYNFQVPFALANTDRRLNEDWAIFKDVPVDAEVRSAAINLAAPGDRRDGQGLLWLGFPRFIVGRHKSPDDFEIPLKIETTNGLGPYRVNADRVAIRNTDRPWLYASQYRGIRKAVLKTDLRQPLGTVTAAQPPAVDGKLAAGEWGEAPAFTLEKSKTAVFLRHDAEHLFVAAKRPAVIGKNGKPLPWLGKTAGPDADVWKDDAFEIFLGDLAGTAVLHLAVSAAGARYDALAAPGKDAGDAKWNGQWQAAAAGDDKFLVAEFAIPLATITGAGLEPQGLAINFQATGSQLNTAPAADADDRAAAGAASAGDTLCRLGSAGRARCANFVPLGLGAAPAMPVRSFTVRLHFAELDGAAGPGTRVFDVRLQGETVLKDFDVAKEAGGPLAAVVKEFKGVRAAGALVFEFGSGTETGARAAPILNAIEITEEK